MYNERVPFKDLKRMKEYESMYFVICIKTNEQNTIIENNPVLAVAQIRPYTWKTRKLRQMRTADLVSMGRKSRQYNIFQYGVQAQLSVHTELIGAICVCLNSLVFHFVLIQSAWTESRACTLYGNILLCTGSTFNFVVFNSLKD